MKGRYAVCIACLVSALIGCGSAYDIGADDADTDAVDDPGETDADPGNDTDAAFDTGSPVESVPPSEWAFALDLNVVGGVVDLASSAATLEGAGGVPDCDVAVGVATLEALTPPTDPVGITQWWGLTWAFQESPPCEWLGPTGVTLGVGPTSVQVYPGADRVGLHAETSLGLYVFGPDTKVVVVGVVGLPEHLDGTVVAPAEGVVADGRWSLRVLYALPTGLSGP